MTLIADKLRVNVQVFEGPLDLLLYLIKRDELDVYDIPIAHITQEYLAYIDVLKELNLDIAGEFLVMAATLINIKSKMLLPRPDGDEGAAEEDPRAELQRRLLEYQRYKEASQLLEGRDVLDIDVFSRPAEPPEAPAPLAESRVDTTLFELVNALKQVLERLPEQKVHEVVRESLSITQSIYEVIDRLKGQARVEFETLFTGAQSRGRVVVTFLAVLELMKRRLIRCQQAFAGSIIHIFPVGNFDDLGDTDFEDYDGGAGDETA
jgi:segregation and condensation protein A